MPGSGANARSSKAHERDATEFQEPDVNQSPGSPSATGPRLTRRSHNKLIAGVASGIGDHFAIEPNLVRLAFVVLAAREAMLNAARHSGAPAIAVYLEVEPEQVTLFVRDRGGGFDVDTVAHDRGGIAESIQGRMQRHGGTAVIRSRPGMGAEIELTMKRTRP